MAADKFEFTAIGLVQSPFKDRFAVPRQHGFANGVRGVVKLSGGADVPLDQIKTALRSLEEFTHIWIVFVFHAHGGKNWKPSIRPPRFGGARKVGVLASRSPHRPNPIGISCVKLERIDLAAVGGPELHISGHDLVDGTPVLDIKPYINAVDILPEANSGWASEPIARWPVEFSEVALGQIKAAEIIMENESADEIVSGQVVSRTVVSSEFLDLVVGVLEIDPRLPAQQRKSPVDSTEAIGSRYGFEILGYDVKYEIVNGGFFVYEVVKIDR